MKKPHTNVGVCGLVTFAQLKRVWVNIAIFNSDPVRVAILESASMKMAVDKACSYEQTVNKTTFGHGYAIERSLRKANVFECSPSKEIVGHRYNFGRLKEDVFQ